MGEILAVGSLGEKLEILKEDDSTEDPATLCGSKHTVIIGVTPTVAEAIPYKSYILVAFSALDTSGAGLVGKFFSEVIEGSLTFVTDPKEWYTTVTGGLGGALADYSQEQGVVYGEGVAGTAAVSIKKTGDWIGKKTGWWAETGLYDAEMLPNGYRRFDATLEEWVGTEYHPANAKTHKVIVTVTNTFGGVTKQVYRTELGGVNAWMIAGDKAIQEPGYKLLMINNPGIWTVNVKSLGSGACADPNLDTTTEFSVATPPNWGQTEAGGGLSAMSGLITPLQAAGIPMAPLVVVGGGILLTGFMIWKLLQAPSE